MNKNGIPTFVDIEAVTAPGFVVDASIGWQLRERIARRAGRALRLPRDPAR